MMEFILCYGAPTEHWGLLPATKLASRKILIGRNIKRRTGPALCVFSLLGRDSLFRIHSGLCTGTVQHSNFCNTRKEKGSDSDANISLKSNSSEPMIAKTFYPGTNSTFRFQIFFSPK
jgi:hypothetical protein